jgi:hypothetical protein
MDWWILELLTTLFLVGLALWLGPFIKRFGKSYARGRLPGETRGRARASSCSPTSRTTCCSPRTLFTITFELPSDWDTVVNGAQVKSEVSRVAGIILIIGLLHGFNLLALPVIGRLLTLNRALDERVGPQGQFPNEGER